jgi:hypothetical protein
MRACGQTVNGVRCILALAVLQQYSRAWPNSPETDQARNPALQLLQSGHLGAKGRAFLQLATHLEAPQALLLALLPLLPALHGVCVTPDQRNVVPTFHPATCAHPVVSSTIQSSYLCCSWRNCLCCCVS